MTGTTTNDPLLNAAPLTHAPGVYGHTVTIPVDGSEPLVLEIPKGQKDNLDWRLRIMRACEEDPDYAQAIRNACGVLCVDSLILWINLFAFTYRQMEVDEDGIGRPVFGDASEIPFITWPCQDLLIRRLFEGITSGGPLVVEKSRDMGASWVILTVFHWFWQFQRNVNFMEISRSEALVDNGNDPDSLFGKHDFLIRLQPAWMLPAMSRTKLQLANLDLRSTIIGKSTTGKQGHGGRKTAVLIDEAGLIDVLEPLWQGLGPTTECRIASSTAHGPGYFVELIESGRVPVLRLPWWEHPEKGRGRFMGTHPFKQTPAIVSPWYLKAAETADAQEFAQNWDMDHLRAGSAFFDHDVLHQRIAQHARPPLQTGVVRMLDPTKSVDAAFARKDVRAFGWFADTQERKGSDGWRLWLELEKDHETGMMRPPQGQTYVFFMDVSHGMGASNSVISVGCAETMEKVAEFADAQVSPDELVQVAFMAALWFGGNTEHPMIGWESNGPGTRVGILLTEYAYPWLMQDVDDSSGVRDVKDRYGWHSTPQKKIDLLGAYRAALARDTFQNPSEKAMREAMGYVWTGPSKVEPKKLVAEGPEARATHGDRVIADAGLVHCLTRAPRNVPMMRKPPPGSPAYERQREE